MKVMDRLFSNNSIMDAVLNQDIVEVNSNDALNYQNSTSRKVSIFQQRTKSAGGGRRQIRSTLAGILTGEE